MNDRDKRKLFNYFISSRKSVPYYFPIDFEHWCESMFHDCDYDGKPLFSHLKTFLLMNEDEIEGFIQFGLTSFIFDKHGEKDYSKQYAVIRNIHFIEHAKNPHLLLDKANEYFDGLKIAKRYAYFHYFGMSCYARQGKLHDTEFHIEHLLFDYGFVKEHENVYYSKPLQDESTSDIPEIDFIFSDNGQHISFMKHDEKIGGCELNFLPQGDICFLKWIFIDEKYSHQGLGTKCMGKLFYVLKSKGILRLDTDTADNNINAQGYYIKTGFSDMGRMRSYCRKVNFFRKLAKNA
ncbi:MAG: GNAT family N-acetyltransferase [Oscillospiraceae bacterium]|nr:GNAT family N-acetyltransferase [Oscillospiraceae bacterium]